MVQRSELVSYTNNYLPVDQFKDYCPNGLQVEGRSEISCMVSGVTASEKLIDAAIEIKADALLVHHGYFWRGESQAIVGRKRNRIAKLLDHGINLLAYHLPLDQHTEVGNNAQLAKLMGWQIDARWLKKPSLPLVCAATLDNVVSAEQLEEKLTKALDRKPLHINGGGEIKRVAWCTGGAQNYLDSAIELGVDAYISGEISEQTVHEARESGVHYFAAGHHATERYGIQALAAHIAARFDVEHHYVEVANPV